MAGQTRLGPEIRDRLTHVETVLGEVRDTLARLDGRIATTSATADAVDRRDERQHTQLVSELGHIRGEIKRLADHLEAQNGRVRKLELWRAEMTARTGVISAIVATLITVILTVGGWIARLKGG